MNPKYPVSSCPQPGAAGPCLEELGQVPQVEDVVCFCRGGQQLLHNGGIPAGGQGQSCQSMVLAEHGTRAANLRAPVKAAHRGRQAGQGFRVEDPFLDPKP
jgi:hypothetical protein